LSNQAKGEFEVKMTPQPDDGSGLAIGRFSLDKTFSGGLLATSQGLMMAVSTETEGSAGYVAMEIVTGILDKRTGTFALQHNGLMNRGQQQLTITVVPDSATEGLGGLSGAMTIDIVDGKHFYVLDYDLPEL
jgi:Protein of unknown function (DUF3224)